jgi:hypothetical protein
MMVAVACVIVIVPENHRRERLGNAHRTRGRSRLGDVPRHREAAASNALAEVMDAWSLTLGLPTRQQSEPTG